MNTPPRPDAPPPRPDAPLRPEVPARRSVPAGGLLLAAGGTLAIVSTGLPWWQVTMRLAFSETASSGVSLGAFYGAASWVGWMAAFAGLGAIVCGLSSLGTPRGRLRSRLAALGVACGLAIVAAALLGIMTGTAQVTNRADHAVAAQNVGGARTVAGYADQIGAGAGRTGAAISFHAAAADGITLALLAGIVAAGGGLLLKRKPGLEPPASPGHP